MPSGTMTPPPASAASMASRSEQSVGVQVPSVSSVLVTVMVEDPALTS